jgi:carbon-monoxide dehydrogenase large subunit
VHSANQGVHVERAGLSQRLGVPVEQIRVLTGDIGGSFGLKIGAGREDVAVAVASRDLRRPVKWMEDRTENLTAAGQAREEAMDVEVACTDEGEILGLRCDLVVDSGAYPGMGGMVGSIVEGMITGPYGIRALQFTSSAVITNKASYVAYRGPWAMETFVRERIVDLIAHELGLEPLEVRRRNVVTHDDEHPPSMITGRSLAGITVAQSFDELEAVFDLAEFRRRQRAAREAGRYLGVGIASYVEAAPGPRGNRPGIEQMYVEIADDGTVVAYTGQMPHGQGHQTTIAQIVADELGVTFEQVRVVVGDTDQVPFGSTGGSRSATMTGGIALHSARALRAKVLEAAAHVMEASPEDLEIVDGEVMVRGVPARGLTLAGLVAALAADGDEHEPLRHEMQFDGGEGGWSGGTHCAVVEVDLGTGLVGFERYIVVEDCGEVINPGVVDGQIRGGIAQGLGAVLLEHSIYGEGGQFVSATMVDYLLPSTVDVPRIEIHHVDPIPLDPDVNFRGVGEGGMIVAPATICNAIEDALAPFGARILEQHLPPSRVLELAGVIEPE